MIEQMNRQQREELYEVKLRFFTNITHEFCTPLTLINGPCEKILSYCHSDTYIHKYASMIQQNALKLNALILELIEFRRLETGNKLLNIKRVPVAEQMRSIAFKQLTSVFQKIFSSIAESFTELAESQELDYRLQIDENIFWNTDVSCLNKIANNLISNAFKYTPEKGIIKVELSIKENSFASVFPIVEKELRKSTCRRYLTDTRFWIILRYRIRKVFHHVMV